MKKLLFLGAAVLSLSIPAARAADMPIVAKAPPPPPIFSWTGCYLGANAGAGWAAKQITDPVQLVQDTLSLAPVTTAVTTVSVDPKGLIVGGQVGCDYQFAPSWVVGVGGSASGSTMKDSTNVLLPLGFPGETALVSARTDFVANVTARFGYAADRWLFFVKGGVGFAGDKYDVTGAFTGIPFAFEGLEQRLGWMVGGGIDWAFYRHWSLALEYEYYQFGHHSVLMSDPVNGSGLVDFKQSVQIAKIGLNFHMWSGQ